MGDSTESTSVHVLDDAPPDPVQREPSHLAVLLALFAAIIVAAVVLSRVPTPPVPDQTNAIDAVGQLRDAVDLGVEADVLSVLANDAILTWPAGPPWGGPLSGSVELVTDPTRAQLLDHVAILGDYLAFHRALNGRTTLARCNVYSEPPAEAPWLADVLIRCDFSIESDLLTELLGDSVAPFGQMRFRVRDDKVAAVLVETWEERFSPIDFLTWIREERPETYEGLFQGRVTLPNYSAETAAKLVALAEEYASTIE